MIFTVPVSLAFAALPVILIRLRERPRQLCVVALAGVFNLVEVTLSLRGLDYDDLFNNPFGSLTPQEICGRHWNTWVGHPQPDPGGYVR